MHSESVEPSRSISLRTPSLSEVGTGEYLSRASTIPTGAEQPVGSPILPGYRIVSEIARGGMGCVWSAFDSTFEREVAFNRNNSDRVGGPGRCGRAYRKCAAACEGLVRDFPDIAEYRYTLAVCRNNLGAVLADLGEKTQAVEAYRQSLTIKEDLVRDFPNVSEYRYELAASYNHLGNVLLSLGDYEESIKAFRRCSSRFEDLARDFPNIPRYRNSLGISYNNLGNVLSTLEEKVAALPVYRQSLLIQQGLSHDSPSIPEYRHSLGASHNLGHILSEQGNRLEGLDWYAKAIVILEKNLEQTPRDATSRLFLRNARWRQAEANEHLGRLADAASSWNEAAECNEDPQLRSILSQNRLRALILQTLLGGSGRHFLWFRPL